MNCNSSSKSTQCARVSEIQRLREIVTRLRSPNGCPWDREQTHKSLAICLVEEASEVLEAIDSENVESMEEELGDLLLQVVFHACLAEENAQFDLEDVARGINEKLIRRHPHVFGGEDERLQTSDEVIDRWELIKASEKKDGRSESPRKMFKDLPPQLPALLFARSVFKQAQKKELEEWGDWDQDLTRESGKKVSEEEVGKSLFELVGACKIAGIDPESALRRFATQQVSKLEKIGDLGQVDS